MDILVKLFAGMLTKLPDNVVKKALDAALDAVETSIANSETTVDDKFVLPAIKWLRQQLGIEETAGSGYEDAAAPSEPDNA